MNIFVTGASGYIGSTTTRVLIQRGHRVRGLARSAAAAAQVRATGAEPVHGSLAELDLLAREAALADAVIHTAASNGPDRPEVDAAAVTAMLSSQRGGAFLTTSGAPVARSSRRPVVEDDVANLDGPLAWLAQAEKRVLDAPRTRGIVVRCPMVYGDGAGPLAGLVQRARAEGVAHVIGSGEACWSTVHVRDVALAYARLIETEAAGVFHASEVQPVSMARLFATVAEVAGVPLRSWSLEEALAVHGPMASFLAHDAALDASKLRGIGWSTTFGEELGGVCGALTNPAQGYRATASSAP